MSQIAEATGIGRATLYKYFPDVEAILLAWHERQVGRHLEQLAAVRDRAGDPGARLAAVLEAYALHRPRAPAATPAPTSRRYCTGASTWPGRSSGSRDFVRDLLVEGARPATSGTTSRPTSWRATASTPSPRGGVPSEAAVRRLVAVTLAGLRPAS